MLFGNSLVNYLFKYRRKACHRICNIARAQSTKVLFFGTDNFSLPSLQKLHQNNLDVGVVTSFKSPANCVRSYAELQKLPLYRWPITADQCAPYELGVVVSFGHLIPVHIINAFPNGIINVHASLLPRWRGAAPIIYAIMNGDDKTGITIMKIQPDKFDIGDIVAQRELPIRSDIFMPELHTSLAILGAELLVDTVNNLEDRLSKAQPQDNKLATYAPKITPAISEVVWSEHTATELYSRHRALYGFKSLTTRFLDKQVQLIELRPPEQNTNLSLSPGAFCFQRMHKSLKVGCANGTQLEVLQIRIEGRKPMSAQDFNNGFLRRAPSLQFTQNKQVVC